MAKRVSTKSPISSRRRFLEAGVASIAAPYFVPSALFGATAPSNRITLGVIGGGNQSMGVLLPKFVANAGAQIVSLCDVNRGSFGYKDAKHFYGREPAGKFINDEYAKQKDRADYRGCDLTADYREIIARDDIEAVVVATPDHWHSRMTIEAAAAGKDIYCEKPLSLTIADGRAMVEAVRKHNRILQTGSNQRSNPVTRHACELVRNGRLGAIKKITAFVGPNNKNGPGPGWKPMPVPDGFDYETWLGPAAEAPYHQDRCLYNFRFIYDYSGGQITNFGAHSNDIVQWALGMDDTGPVEVEYVSATWPETGSLFNTALRSKFLYRYANGQEVSCETSDRISVGVRFEGKAGTLTVTNRGLSSEPASLAKSIIGKNEVHLYKSDDHTSNFIDCVKSRQTPAAPVEVGHRSASICHLGAIACRLGQQGEIGVLRWDPKAEQFTNSESANRLLVREKRNFRQS
jgi:predicted dehydrogenase